ncbi:hypothetical protein VPH35_051595 [Triticum aestivum]
MTQVLAPQSPNPDESVALCAATPVAPLIDDYHGCASLSLETSSRPPGSSARPPPADRDSLHRCRRRPLRRHPDSPSCRRSPRARLPLPRLHLPSGLPSFALSPGPPVWSNSP